MRLSGSWSGVDSITCTMLKPIAGLADGGSCGAWTILGGMLGGIDGLCDSGVGGWMGGCVGIGKGIGAVMVNKGDCVTSTGLCIAGGLGGAAGTGGADVIEVAIEAGGGSGVIGVGVSVGVGDGAAMGVSIGAGIGVGAGAMISGSGMGGCDWGVGSRGAIDGSTFVVMATAIVIGELICPVVVDVGAGETSTIWAVLLRLVSGDGSGFGEGLSP